MLQLLETGRALYIMAGVCLLGIVSRMITRSLYRRLIKESENLTLTKNRQLKELKQRLESSYRTNQGIRDTRSYLERQLFTMQFRGFTLSGWNSLSTQLTLLTVMVGGAGSFFSYWYRLDSYYIVLYGTMGILFALLMMMFDIGNAAGDRWQQLVATLQDYVDNVLIMRLSKSLSGEMAQEAPDEPAFVSTREKIRSQERQERQERQGRQEIKERQPVSKRPPRTARGEIVKGKPQAAEERKDVDELKHGLEQIAASHEKTKPDGNWLKELNEEELQLIGNIIREYLV